MQGEEANTFAAELELACTAVSTAEALELAPSGRQPLMLQHCNGYMWPEMGLHTRCCEPALQPACTGTIMRRLT